MKVIESTDVDCFCAVNEPRDEPLSISVQTAGIRSIRICVLPTNEIPLRFRLVGRYRSFVDVDDESVVDNCE